MRTPSIQILDSSPSRKDEGLWILGMLGHDLHAPLGNLQGFLGLLKVTSLDGYQRDCLETALECTADLAKMLNGILDGTRLCGNRLEVHCQPTDLPALVRGTMHQFRLMAEEKGLTLDLEVISGVPRLVSIDRAKVQQILTNLIGNAIKFTEVGGVTVGIGLMDSVDDEPAAMQLEISDSGIGVPEDQIFSIFEAHYQVTPGHDSKSAGLGLSIVKKLVANLNGGIAIHSVPGAGTAIKVTLPIPSG